MCTRNRFPCASDYRCFFGPTIEPEGKTHSKKPPRASTESTEATPPREAPRQFFHFLRFPLPLPLLTSAHLSTTHTRMSAPPQLGEDLTVPSGKSQVAFVRRRKLLTRLEGTPTYSHPIPTELPASCSLVGHPWNQRCRIRGTTATRRTWTRRVSANFDLAEPALS